MFCKNCGTQLPDGSMFCPSCGTKVEIPEEIIPAAAAAAATVIPEINTEAPAVETPAEPVVIDIPETPAEPVKVDIPETPAEPVKVDIPETPAEPVKAEIPEVPAEPVVPEAPAAPVAPVTPAAPQPTVQYTPPQPAYQQPVQTYTQPVQTAVQTKEPKKSKKGLIAGLIIGGAVLLLAIIAVVLVLVMSNRKINLDLKPYVKGRFEGYNTVGTGDIYFDTDAFVADYGDKIKVNPKYKNDEDEIPARILSDFILAYPKDYSKMYNLSNGDVVTGEVEVFGEVSEYFNVVVDPAKFDVDITVSGLSDAPVFDPFEGLVINTTGFEPFGRIELDTSACPEPFNANSYTFNVDKDSELSNGDTVVISVPEYQDTEYFLTQFGKIPSKTSMEYTVEGIGKLVTAFSDIPESALTELNDAFDAIFKADVIDVAHENQSIEDIEYVGYILETMKEPSEYSSYNNTLYYVYKYNLVATSASSDDGIFSLYCVFALDNVIVKDGKIDADMDSMYMIRHPYEFTQGTWTVSGNYAYPTLTEVEEDLINQYTDCNYEYDLPTND